MPSPYDIESQKPLSNPPEVIKAIYATNWSAGSPTRMHYLIDLIDQSELNALVIDIKDYSGVVGYVTDSKLLKEYRTEEARISKINALIKQLHDKGIYIIGRVAVFQDQKLIEARPDLALTSSSTGMIWRDQKGLGWVDPASKDVWDYTIEIARDAFDRGFDEINFDYIRFPTDGALNDLRYPVWDKKTSYRKTMKEFFSYLREELAGHTISADVFGLVPAAHNDLGIGQYFEDILPYFDYIAPMTYPSHYASGVFGFTNPAENPRAIVYETITRGLQRRSAHNLALNGSTTQPVVLASLRPWLQDFDLGAEYTAEMVRAQIDALASTTSNAVSGWMLWNPSNVYTKSALQP